MSIVKIDIVPCVVSARRCFVEAPSVKSAYHFALFGWRLLFVAQLHWPIASLIVCAPQMPWSVVSCICKEVCKKLFHSAHEFDDLFSILPQFRFFLQPSIWPFKSLKFGFHIRGCRSLSSGASRGYHFSPCLISSHALKIPWINLSSYAPENFALFSCKKKPTEISLPWASSWGMICRCPPFQYMLPWVLKREHTSNDEFVDQGLALCEGIDHSQASL